MILWIDAQLSPALAPWVTGTFSDIEAFSVRYLDLHEAEDAQIYKAAREAGAVVMTKDSDFVQLLERRGAPPKVIWITCGNTSNARMREILDTHLRQALSLLDGEDLVEISDLR